MDTEDDFFFLKFSCKSTSSGCTCYHYNESFVLCDLRKTCYIGIRFHNRDKPRWHDGTEFRYTHWHTDALRRINMGIRNNSIFGCVYLIGEANPSERSEVRWNEHVYSIDNI